MKKLFTALTQFKTESLFSLVVLVLIATLCVVFQHQVITKMRAASKPEARQLHHVIVVGKHMSASEKLAFDQEPVQIDIEQVTDKNKSKGD